MPLDIEKVIAGIHDYMERAFAPLIDRIKGIENRLDATPPPKDGKDGTDGVDGKSISVEDVMPVLRELVEALPTAKDGIDGKDGNDGVDGKSITVEDVMPVLRELVEALPTAKDGIDGKDGTDGVDGKSITVDEVLPHVKQWFDALPVPKDGEQGKSITLDDIKPMMETAMATWELHFERRAFAFMQQCIDRMPKPKDGIDGLQLEDFNATLLEDGRTLVLSLSRGDISKEVSLRLNHPIYRGIYKADGKYLQGDSCTFGGSTFIATRDNPSKPETDDSWICAVKRGRDARNEAVRL
jgi:hypothetical protein